jgi:carbon-monoxide dehydrogenase large subunit
VTKAPVNPQEDAPPVARYVGQGVPRREDDRFVRGAARYVADIRAGGALHAAFLRSAVAAGRITSIDVSGARTMPGVVAALSGADLAEHIAPLGERNQTEGRFAAGLNVESEQITIRAVAVDRVHYVGEPIAVVVAENRYLAEDALEAIQVEYDVAPAVTDMEAALCGDSATVHDIGMGNTAVRMSYVRELPGPPVGEVAAVVEGTYRFGRQTAMPMECRGVLAAPDGSGHLDIWDSSQGPFPVKRTLCAVTGWDPSTVSVRSPAVGGGFGQKVNVYGEEIVVPVMAKLLDKPVVWLEDRYENLISATQGRDQLHRARLSVDRDGRILEWEDEFLVDLGAYNFARFGVVGNTALHLLGPYRIPTVRVKGTGVYTNKAPTSQYRGAGRPESTFALERALDAAARELGIESWKIREINALSTGDLPLDQLLPYRDGADIVYDGDDYKKVFQEAATLVSEVDLDRLKSECDATARVGIGVAGHMEATGRGPEAESVRIRLTPAGHLLVFTGIGVSGQSHETAFSQIAADAARMDMDLVTVVTGDTDEVPQSLASVASRSAVIGGSAVHLGVTRLAKRIGERIGVCYETSEVEHVDGGFRVDGEFLSWQQVGQAFAPNGKLAGDDSPELVESFTPPAATWLMGAHVAVVRVELDTGSVSVIRYGIAHEGGASINPRVVDGQLRGGAAQGIGGALYEEVLYDTAGQPLSATMADYAIPTAANIPTIDLIHLHSLSTRNPLGLKGIGESGIIGSAAAVASAVDDALREFGTHATQVPLTADRVLALIDDAPGERRQS